MIRILNLPGLPIKGDLVDFAKQRTGLPPDSIRAEIEQLGATAPEWKPAVKQSTDPSSQPTANYTARTLAEIPRATAGDQNELLRHRFLCRCGTLLLVGLSGIGKSALLLQLLLAWAASKATVGLEPTRPLKSVLVQTEDDDGDLAEMRDGILTGFVETGVMTQDEADAAAQSVVVVTAPEALDEQLRPVLEQLIAEHKPDIVAINPAFGFVTGDTAKAQDVTKFLRGRLQPIAVKTGVAFLLVHHGNKPSGKGDKPDYKAGDNAYWGSGSAEWANFSRAVLVVKSLGSSSVFQLVAGKRGKRLRWTDSSGQPTESRFIAHAKEPEQIFWREPDPEEVAAVVGNTATTAPHPGRQFEGNAKTDARNMAKMFAEQARNMTDTRHMIRERLGKKRGDRAFDELTREPSVYGLHVAQAAWRGTAFLGSYSAATDAANALDAEKDVSGNQKPARNEAGAAQ